MSMKLTAQAMELRVGNSKTISIAEQLADRSWAQNKNNQSGGGAK